MHKKIIRLLVVDDHAIVRQGLRMLLNLRPDLTVIGEASTTIEAIQQALDLQPDLILLDLILPDGDGITIVPQLQQMSPSSKILVLSSAQSASSVQKAVNAGIHGYVPKEATPDELVTAIHMVIEGQTYLHPQVASLLLKSTQQNALGLPIAPPRSIPSLTQREQDVLTLMAITATNKEIATHLSLGQETVRTHVKNLLRKLGQKSRTQAVVEAIRVGLIEL